MIIKYKGQTLEAAAHEEAYSTEETRIGTWIDGKPVYQKVISGKTPKEYDTNVVVDPVLTYEYMNALIAISGYTYRAGNKTIVPVNAALPENVNAQFWIRSDGLNMRITESVGANNPFYIIVKYTKAAD